jgi:26S proteasome regulatory subunit N7
VYQAGFAMYARNFKQAASLFQEALATFGAMELFPYERVVFYAVITSIIALDRVSLKSKVVDAPEVLTSIAHIPALQQYLESLYACRYKEFFQVSQSCRIMRIEEELDCCTA